MDDYISRTKLKDCIRLIATMPGGIHVADILNLIDKAPEADVAPVRRGSWRMTGRTYEGLIEIQCSECNEATMFDVIWYDAAARYCPFCGAKLDGGADNGE